MFKTLLSRKHQRRPAQALVEFSLIALVFLMLLVMIIEIARLLQAYVTIQHAAREAARYAVTGQYNDKYAGPSVPDMRSGWNTDPTVPINVDPLQRIPPCWPRYPFDPWSPPVVIQQTPTGGEEVFDSPLLWEPYRDARTCSVEETAIRSMSGLVMNPMAREWQPDYYHIAVSGYTEDRIPMEGDFERESGSSGDLTSVPRALFYPAVGWTTPPPQYDGPGMVRGYAGLPGQKVVIRIVYRLRFITPLLSNIVPSVPLTATAIMTNETFGGTSLQRDAVPQPPLPEVPPIMVSPPNLIVESAVLTSPAATDITETTPLIFTAVVKNIGDSTRIGGKCDLNIYYSTTDLGAVSPLEGAVESASVQVDNVDLPAPGASTVPYTLQLPPSTLESGRTYWIYAWVDDTSRVTEGAVDSPAEKDNVKLIGTYSVKSQADLAVVSKGAPVSVVSIGTPFIYTIVVTNASGADAPDVVVRDELQPELEFLSADYGGTESGNTVTWNLGTLAAGATRTLTVTVQVRAGTSTTIVINNTASIDTTSPALSDSDRTNNEKSADPITIGGFDLAVDKTADRASASEGETVNFDITVTNVSTLSPPVTAATFNLVDTWPAQMTFLTSSVPGCIPASCTVNNLAQGATFSVRFSGRVEASAAGLMLQNTATVPGASVVASDGSPETSTDNNTKTVEVAVKTTDLEITKTASPSSVELGSEFTYTITVTNYGPSDASSVIVEDVLDSRLTLVSTSPSRGVYSGSTWNIGNIPAPSGGVPATAELRLRMRVGGSGNAIIPNRARIISFVGTDPTDDDHVADCDVAVAPAFADLEIEKRTGITEVVGDQNIDYTISVTNNGTSNATGVTVEDILNPAYLTYVTSFPAGAYNSTTGVWTIGNLANGATSILLLRAQVTADLPLNTPIDNTASIASLAEMDSDLTNNESTYRVTVTNRTDMAIDKSVSPAIAGPGATVTYTLAVTNRGPANTLNREVQDAELASRLGSGYFTLVSATATRGTVNPTTGRWTDIDLARGQRATATIRVKVAGATTDDAFSNTASVVPSTEGQTDPISTNDSDAALLTIKWPTPIFINTGSYAGCGEQTWNGHTWRRTQNLSGAHSWGLVDGAVDFSMFEPQDTRSVRHVTSSHAYVGDSANNLMGCHVTGVDFTYAFEGDGTTPLSPGVYRLFLLFAANGFDKGDQQIRVSVNEETLPGMENYDPTQEITGDPYHTCRLSSRNYTCVHYIMRTIEDIEVTGSRISVRFEDVYGTNPAYLSGIGIEFQETLP